MDYETRFLVHEAVRFESPSLETRLKHLDATRAKDSRISSFDYARATSTKAAFPVTKCQQQSRGGLLFGPHEASLG